MATYTHTKKNESLLYRENADIDNGFLKKWGTA